MKVDQMVLEYRRRRWWLRIKSNITDIRVWREERSIFKGEGCNSGKCSDKPNNVTFFKKRSKQHVTHYRKVKQGEILTVRSGFCLWWALVTLRERLKMWGQMQPEEEGEFKEEKTVREDWFFM